jgi:serine protease
MVTFQRSAMAALVLLMLALVVPSAVARGSGGVALPGFAPDRVLAGFTPGTAAETARAIEASAGARQIGIVGAGTHLLQVPAGHVLSVVAALKASPLVRYAEPDWMLAADQTPNDPDFSNQWGLLNTGQSIDVTQDTSISGTPAADIKATAAWNVTTGTAWDPTTKPSAPVVGVVDSGVYYNHPDLAPNIWSDPRPFDFRYSYTDTGGGVHTDTTCPSGSHGWDSIRHVCDPYDPTAAPWHGSMTSGVIGAKGNNATGGSGVNWNVSIVGLRWDQNSCLCGYTSQTIEAIDYGVQAKQAWDASAGAQGANVRVLSNSYGCCYPVSTGTGKLPYDPALLDEVRKAGDSNILFVASGGNSSYNIDPPNYSHGHYPCSFDNANTFGTYDATSGTFTPDTSEQSLGPAKNVICVASSDYNDQRSSFSNWGPQTVQLAAPGTSIYSTNASGSYSFGSGTSLSTPFVAGVAALILSQHPNMDVVTLKHALVGTYSQESAAYSGCPCGYQGGGAIDQLPALSGLLSTGGGRLNACKALDNANQLLGLPAVCQPGTPQSDFTLSASPSSVSTSPGASVSYSVSVGSSGGFNGSVALSVSGVPSATTSTFSPSSVVAPGSSTLSVATSSSTSPGTYSLTITGTSGTLVHTTSVTLVVNASSDFALSISPGSRSIRAGGTTSYSVSVSSLSGFTGTVTFSVSGLPQGASASFNPTSVTGAGSSTLAVQTTASTTSGRVTLVVTGTSGAISHTVAAALTIR